MLVWKQNVHQRLKNFVNADPIGANEFELDIDTDEEATTLVSPKNDFSFATVAFSGFVLVSFVILKSSLAILLALCHPLHKEYPFVLQTVSVFPFLAQVCFYTGLTCRELGFNEGIQAVLIARKDMYPAVLYSSLTACSTLLQTLSLSYIKPSTYVVLMQLTMVLIALGDRFVLKKPSTPTIWFLVLSLATSVTIYQLDMLAHESASGANGHSAEASAVPSTNEGEDMTKLVMGLAICLTAETCQAAGCILQQQFIQQASKDIGTNIKLCYQHLIGLAIMIITVLMHPHSLSRVVNDGFFYGWDHYTVATTCVMWLAFLAASTVTAYISALAGAMGGAMVVVIVGTHGVMVNGDSFSNVQCLMVVFITCTTMSLTYLKGKM